MIEALLYADDRLRYPAMGIDPKAAATSDERLSPMRRLAGAPPAAPDE
ncbi:MAG: hypothetical protein JO027_05815 [Solirubrobacterales bacterium]|nr:hypothetical protein [Solirubrobacterales bacterium]